MGSKASPAVVLARNFYSGESTPKRSRLEEGTNLRPAFKHLKDNLLQFDKKLSEPIKSSVGPFIDPLPEQNPIVTSLDDGPVIEEPKNVDRDSPLPLKNLGNTCYENSIIQCLFSLGMFMENFASSMDEMRQYVVKAPSKEFGPENFSTNLAGRDELGGESKENASSSAEPNLITQKPQSPQPLPSAPITQQISGTNNQHSPKTMTDDDVRYRISDAFDKLYKSYTCTVSVEQSEIETRLEDLKSAVGERSSQFNSTHQQDASEFFYHVIDSIQEFYQGLDRSHNHNNPVTKAFELELDYMIRCPKCHHKVMSESEKIRTLPLALPQIEDNENRNLQVVEYMNGGAISPTPPASDLSLDSPEPSVAEENKNGSDEKENQALVNELKSAEDNINNTMSIAKLDLAGKSEQSNSQSQSSSSEKKKYTLDDALDNYFKDDLLDFSCSQPGCDSKQRTKKCLIRKLPQVLFITLARYSHTGKKSLDEIEAPFELSVPFQENKSPSHSPSAHREFNDDEDKYQLVAVVCHLGSSLNAGHYTSYVFNHNNSSWYCCDDDSITKAAESDVKTDASKSGYCFFYAHRSCLPAASPPAATLCTSACEMISEGASVCPEAEEGGCASMC